MTQSDSNHHADVVATGEPTRPASDDAAAAHAADDIGAQLAKVQTEVAELKDAWLRAKAETDNIRRIAQGDVAKAHKFAAEKFAEDMLPVKDALEQTLATSDASIDTLKAGVDLTLKALQSAFSRAQITELNPVGEKFDPHRHQAIQMVDSDLPPGSVVSVLQKGHLLNDRVLRPALVTVAKGES
jgi:molecular chaperone GrpE